MILSKSEDRELRKSVARATKKLIDSLKQEPTSVIVIGEAEDNKGCIDEITEWLFHGRNDNGSSGN